MKPSIEISSICNLRCQMCPYQHKGIDQGMMSWELFTKLADELAPLSEAIHIFNRGEPFTHPRIYDMIDYLQPKCQIIIATNALLMDEKRIYNHLKNGLLVVSCHAGDRETYKEVTGTDGFEEVKRKIFYLRDNQPEGVDFRVKLVQLPNNEKQEEVLKGWGVRVDIVPDSNRPNPYHYEDCTQPDVCPTWDFKGHKKVCCRDEHSTYDHEKYYEEAKQRKLEICQRCAIR